MATLGRVFWKLSIVLIAAFHALNGFCSEKPHSLVVQLENSSSRSRPETVIEIPLKAVFEKLRVPTGTPIEVLSRKSKQRLLFQIYASHVGADPDELLVLTDIDAHERKQLLIRTVTPSIPFPSMVTARAVPERKDDFAWENDLVAYRVYGPALQATGEITSGVDVWSKRTSQFVTTKWYEQDKKGISYHQDHGEGLDSYDVGPTPGCGGTAVYWDGKFFPSKNYVSARILANGPIRTDFVLEYAPWSAGDLMVRETKRITLDAGSRLNRIRSTFETIGTDRTFTVSTGLVMHQGAKLDRPSNSILSVWDVPQSASAGRIGVALVLSPQNSAQFLSLNAQSTKPGEAWFIFPARSGLPIEYFAGSAWSKAGFDTQAEFNKYLEDFADSIRTPITVRIH